jgi:hypothetical protein
MWSLDVIQYMNSPAGLAQLNDMKDDCESCKYKHPDTCKPCRQDKEERKIKSHRKQTRTAEMDKASTCY